MAIEYIAYTWQGRKVTGLVETESVDAVYDMLAQDELIPYRVRAAKPRRPLVEILPGLFKPKARDLIDFSRQISSLLKSGIPLRRALATLREESHSTGLKWAIHNVLKDIEGGKRLSDAMERHPTVFPTFYIRLVRVGEASGGLGFTLERIVETLEQRKSVQDKVRAALVYPLISFVVAIVAGYVLVTFSLPALTDLLEDFGGELPLTTQILQNLTEFMRQYITHVLASVIGMVTIFFLYTRTLRGARQRDLILLQAPVIGGVLRKSNMFSLTSTLKTLIQAGVPLIEALRLSSQAVGNIPLREAVEATTKDAESGVSLGQSFRRQKLFPPLITQGIVTGEMSGTLSDTLSGLADFYRQETERSVNSATELIQPTIILLVAGVVGFLAIAVISGIYSTLGAVAA